MGYRPVAPYSAATRRVENGDGTWSSAIDFGLSTRTHRGRFYTWKFAGYQRVPLQPGAALPREYEVRDPPEDAEPTASTYPIGACRVDMAGRRWVVVAVNHLALAVFLKHRRQALDYLYGRIPRRLDRPPGPTPWSPPTRGNYSQTSAWRQYSCPSGTTYTKYTCGSEGQFYSSDARSAISGTLSAEQKSAVVIIDSDDAPFCSGVTLGSRYVLTAAHCAFADDGSTPREVGTICTRGRFGGASRCVDGWEIVTFGANFEYYWKKESLWSTAYDWALLKLPEDLSGSSFAAAALSDDSACEIDGENVTAPGYAKDLHADDGCPSQVYPSGGFSAVRETDQPAAEVESTIHRSVRTKLATSHGASGSPMFLDKRVVGLLVGYHWGANHWTGGPRIPIYADEIESYMADDE